MDMRKKASEMATCSSWYEAVFMEDNYHQFSSGLDQWRLESVANFLRYKAYTIAVL